MPAPWEQFQPQQGPQPWTQFQPLAKPPDQPTAEPSTVLGRIGTGLGDVVSGGAQLLTHVLPQSVVDVGNKINNALASSGVPLAQVPAGGVDQMVKDREAQYEAQRKAAGSTGVDWARLAGNVLNPVNLVGGAAALPETLAGRAAVGAGLGAANAALQPAAGQDGFWGQKAGQVAAGAATGAALPAIGAAASRIINPETSSAVQDLTQKGISPTLGQMLGGTSKTMEDKLMSLPVVGDVITHARRGAVQDMNRSLYQMALDPIGETSTAQIGREGVQEVQQKLSNAYGSLLQGKTIPLDNQFSQQVSDIFNQAGGMMSNDARSQFMNILKNKVLNVRDPQGNVSGDMMKAVDTQLGQMSRQFGKQQDINSQMIGDGLDSVQQALRDAVGRADPALQAGLNKVNQGWATYARIRNAASRTGSKEGVVTPGTLNSAVTALDNSVAKGGTATGTAPMRRFADNVNSVLGSQYPDSGTAGRTLLNLLLTGGGMYLHPTSMMLAGAAMLPSAMRRTTAALMTQRPDIAQPIANAVQQGAAYLAPAAGGIAGRIAGQ